MLIVRPLTYIWYTLQKWVRYRLRLTAFVIILTRLYDLSISVVAAGIEAVTLKY